MRIPPTTVKGGERAGTAEFAKTIALTSRIIGQRRCRQAGIRRQFCILHAVAMLAASGWRFIVLRQQERQERNPIDA